MTNIISALVTSLGRQCNFTGAKTINGLIKFGLTTSHVWYQTVSRKKCETGNIFGYYSKIAEEAHVIDWTKFDNDREYMTMVSQSNMLDA